MLGLRSMFLALAALLLRFRYLKVSLALVLAVVGVKMLAAQWLRPLLGGRATLWLLGAVLLILASGVFASVLAERANRTEN